MLVMGSGLKVHLVFLSFRTKGEELIAMRPKNSLMGKKCSLLGFVGYPCSCSTKIVECTMVPLFNFCFSVFTWIRLACEVASFVVSRELVVSVVAAQALSLGDDTTCFGMFDNVCSSIACDCAPNFVACDLVLNFVVCGTVRSLVACDTMLSSLACNFFESV
jgi:hypothetical protein